MITKLKSNLYGVPVNIFPNFRHCRSIYNNASQGCLRLCWYLWARQSATGRQQITSNANMYTWPYILYKVHVYLIASTYRHRDSARTTSPWHHKYPRPPARQCLNVSFDFGFQWRLYNFYFFIFFPVDISNRHPFIITSRHLLMS